MSKAKRKELEEAIEGPAIITADHVQDRVLSPRAGAKKGWSKLAVYEKEFRRGALACKERCTSAVATRKEEARALDRLAAARALDQGWRIIHAPFPGGVDFDRVRSSVAQAVMTVSPAYKFSTLARFREALDALVEGMRRGKPAKNFPGRIADYAVAFE
jgi:hypothetical protein